MPERAGPRTQGHPSGAVLTAFAVGNLGEAQFALVERHVSGCDRCATIVADAPRDAFVDRLLAAEQSHWASRNGSGATAAGKLAPLANELRDHPRYEMLRLIAEGGMSWVYLARHRLTQSLVAIKSIKPECAVSGELTARFLREARLAARLSHENVVRVLDAEQCGDTAFIVMEHVPGRTLAELVAVNGPLPVADACRYVRQIALGLEHASELGVVHRDMKPQNVVVVPDTDTARILDFGLGRLTDEHRVQTRLTRDNQILGSPDYMAPEQAQHAKSADVRSDIYSLGCTFYFLLTGRPPLEADNVVDLLTKHASETPASLVSVRPDVPRNVAKLVNRMLSKDPRNRPQSLGEIARALDAHASRPAADYNLSAGRLPALGRAVLTPAVLLPLLTALVCLLVFLIR